ncbi:MAG: AbrB/MazE/SpoVT family DNA-binding domain-containing protein [Gammaproteobacteria bacterium]|jgi:bifunctional DNA-binding transcriptional regulator/antitoxin component of YhaV-PrlF toxin-antitoxin module
MPRISAKRQITIPISLCQEAHIQPGDEIETFIYNGQITIVKKERSAAKGILRHVKYDKRMSDEQSLQSALKDKHTGAS